jgi:EAL domain-containing protein (putative c-di-GMP-specific phosphodiesterase class I)
VGDALRSSAVAEAVTATISLPLQVSGHDIRIAASCGVAISPAHGQDAEELMGNADLALYHAKSNGSGRTFLFTPSLRREAIERRRVDAELHRAVEDNQFELFYQPQVRITDGEVVGAEALIRWKHPERGYLTPAHFLASLDGGPLAGAVGTWGIDTACAQVEKWHMAGATGLRMGVNLFAAQFMTRDLVDCIRHALERHKLPAQTLELEITENIILNRDDLILEPLQQLRAMGVCIAFDDFGTGYASLSLLKNYPLTRIKIDQTFISNMCNSRRDEATVAATLDLARNYELEVIAEGVETNEQLEKLMQLRCDEAQGYLFGKPMPAAQFEELLGNPLRVE